MGQSIYITDPAVAAAYTVHPGEWVWVDDEAEALWLLANRHGYSLAATQPVPAAYFVHPDAPLPFVPYAGPGPGPSPSPPPSPPPSPSPSPPSPSSPSPTPPAPSSIRGRAPRPSVPPKE